MAKTVQTVLGEIPVEEMGFVLPHEHVFSFGTNRWLGLADCKSVVEMEWATKAVTPDMQTWLRTHPWSNFNNLIRLEYEDSLEEIQNYRNWGGDTFVDVTVTHGVPYKYDFALDMQKISRATGVHIIGSTGYLCVNDAMEQGEEKLSIDELAQILIDEIRIGNPITGIKAGCIKAMIWDLFEPLALKYLTACGMAQKETGLPVYVHPDLMNETNHIVLDTLEAAGADLTKVVLCHVGPLLDHYDYNKSLLDRGCYLEHDECGSEIFDNSKEVLAHFPRDIDTIRLVKKYVEWGYEDQFLLSMD